MSQYSSSASIFTLAKMPSNGSINIINSNNILVTWEANNNPEGTFYSIAAFDLNGQILIHQNQWTSNLSDTVTNLDEAIIYTIKVKAKNSNNIETDWYTVGFTASNNQFVKISVGDVHSLALKADGTLWACGDNHSGQLGIGLNTQSTNMPVQVSGLYGITAISGGGRGSLALKNDGTVWAWGLNYNGQLGNGTTTDSFTPIQVSELNGIAAISGGNSHSLALKNDGTVWAWGSNYYGELGNGTTTESSTPKQVSALYGISAIAVGDCYSLALKNDGTVWAWGKNFIGQLGDGTTTHRKSPVQVSGLSDVIFIASGEYHNLALKNDGTVWAWGSNSYGKLGDGTTIDRVIPVQVSGLNGIVSIAAGSGHSLALKNDGTVWAWGINIYGMLGDGTTTNRITPVKVNRLVGITAIIAGEINSLAINNKGTIWAWGNGYCGQMGNGEEECFYEAILAFGTTLRTTITNTFTCIEGIPFNYVVKVDNIKNLSDKTFTITYNQSEIAEIVDLCSMTYSKDVDVETIQSTDITILQNGPGIIKFTVNKIKYNQTWSGTVNIIEFKPILNQVTILCTID